MSNDDTKHLSLQIIGANCVSCAKIIGKQLGRRRGIKGVNVNPMLNVIYVDYDAANPSQPT